MARRRGLGIICFLAGLIFLFFMAGIWLQDTMVEDAIGRYRNGDKVGAIRVLDNKTFAMRLARMVYDRTICVRAFLGAVQKKEIYDFEGSFQDMQFADKKCFGKPHVRVLVNYADLNFRQDGWSRAGKLYLRALKEGGGNDPVLRSRLEMIRIELGKKVKGGKANPFKDLRRKSPLGRLYSERGITNNSSEESRR